MTVEIIMPKLGFDMQEGVLLNWLKKKGDKVNVGEPIAEIETDKAAIEVEAFHAGILTELFYEPGQLIKVGAIIGLLEGEGGIMSTPAHLPAKTSQFAVGSDQAPSVPRNDQSLLEIGFAKSARMPVKISPLARRLAEERGIDVGGLQGTGPGGMIVKRDIPTAEAELTFQRTPMTPSARRADDEKMPLSRRRMVIARRMMQSHIEIPQFDVAISIEMDKALDLRSRYNAIHPGQPLSINDLIIRASALVLRRFPRLNSAYREQELQVHHHINIGVAVALEDGLVTVVIRDADQKSLAELSQETQSLIERTRQGKNRPEDMEGSTFTVSNLGMYGINEFNAIINPPEAAILAVGAALLQPKWVDETWRRCSSARFNLSVDHRVSDGAEAAQFLKELQKYMEEPVYLI